MFPLISPPFFCSFTSSWREPECESHSLSLSHLFVSLPFIFSFSHIPRFHLHVLCIRWTDSSDILETATSVSECSYAPASVSCVYLWGHSELSCSCCCCCFSTSQSSTYSLPPLWPTCLSGVGQKTAQWTAADLLSICICSPAQICLTTQATPCLPDDPLNQISSAGSTAVSQGSRLLCDRGKRRQTVAVFVFNGVYVLCSSLKYQSCPDLNLSVDQNNHVAAHYSGSYWFSKPLGIYNLICLNKMQYIVYPTEFVSIQVNRINLV